MYECLPGTYATPAKPHSFVCGQTNMMLVYAARFTPAAVALSLASVCHVRQSQPVVLASIVYQPKTEAETVIAPFDSSS